MAQPCHGLQVVADADTLADYDAVIKRLNTGASVAGDRDLGGIPAKGQRIELTAETI
jgi:asparaginyl-tRNA synthetase